MKINTQKNDSNLVVALEGRLDTNTAGQLESTLNESLTSEVKDFILDFEKLAYISSAGLRVVLGAQKKMNANDGKMTVKNVNETIMEVFEITGFVDVLNIEA